jgi:chemotaxis protein histidine kinase CheA
LWDTLGEQPGPELTLYVQKQHQLQQAAATEIAQLRQTVTSLQTQLGNAVSAKLEAHAQAAAAEEARKSEARARKQAEEAQKTAEGQAAAAKDAQKTAEGQAAAAKEAQKTAEGQAAAAKEAQKTAENQAAAAKEAQKTSENQAAAAEEELDIARRKLEYSHKHYEAKCQELRDRLTAHMQRTKDIIHNQSSGTHLGAASDHITAPGEDGWAPVPVAPLPPTPQRTYPATRPGPLHKAGPTCTDVLQLLQKLAPYLMSVAVNYRTAAQVTAPRGSISIHDTCELIKCELIRITGELGGSLTAQQQAAYKELDSLLEQLLSQQPSHHVWPQVDDRAKQNCRSGCFTTLEYLAWKQEHQLG